MLSLAAGTVLDAAAPEVVAAASDAGFDACGLRLDPADTPRSLVAAVRRRLHECDMALLDLEVIRMQPGAPAEDHLPLLELAADLGARWVLTVLQIPEAQEQIDRLGRLVEVAAELDVRIALEFMAFTSVRTLADATALASAVPGCRIIVDALHLARTGGSAAQVAAHVEMLAYVQLCDGPASPPGAGTVQELAEEARHRRMLPGHGAFDLGALVAATPSDVPISVEVQSDEMAASMSPQERAASAYSAARRLLLC